MSSNKQPAGAGMPVIVCLIFLTAIAMKDGLISDPQWYKLAWVSVPLLIVMLIVNRVFKTNSKKNRDISFERV